MRSKAEPISKHVLKGFNFYVKNFYVDNQVIVICTELLKALGKKNKTFFYLQRKQKSSMELFDATESE